MPKGSTRSGEEQQRGGFYDAQSLITGWRHAVPLPRSPKWKNR
jgi:hypothetical protein